MKEKFLRNYLAKLSSFQAVFRTVEAEGIIMMGDKIGEPILDLGCGDGIFSEVLLGRGKNIVGIDIDGKALVQAGRRRIYKRIVKGDVHVLPFPDSSFNTVLANSCLEHISNLKIVLKEIHRVLKSGGSLILSAPSEKREKLFLAGKYENGFFRHLNCWSSKKWQKVLEETGFKKVAYEYKCSPKTALLGDLLLITAPFGYLEKKIFGRYLGWRKYPSFLLYLLLRKYEDNVEKENGAIIIVRALK